METFSLQIMTPDGCAYEGEAEKLFCRTIAGDVGILAHHCDYCSALGMGEAHVVTGDKTRYAACMGGMLSVMGGKVRLLATTWEWAEQIDKERAAAAHARADEELKQKDLDERAMKLAEARLHRAMVRESVAK